MEFQYIIGNERNSRGSELRLTRDFMRSHVEIDARNDRSRCTYSPEESPIPACQQTDVRRVGAQVSPNNDMKSWTVVRQRS